MPKLNTFATFTKFREVSADKLIFNGPGHSIELPEQLTVTSTMPTPRKGNPGPVKTSLSFNKSIILDQGLDSQRTAPIVIKVDVSLPVGTTLSDYIGACAVIFGAVTVEDSPGSYDTTFVDLTRAGLLPA